MDKQTFHDKFKQEIEPLFNTAVSKADRCFDQYWAGKMDGIEAVEAIFDKAWKEFEKENNL